MNKISNMSVLGFAAFAIALWMSSMIPAGWFDVTQATLALLTAVVLGGSVMAVAGILNCLQGHTLDSVLFLAFAGYWWIAFLEARASLHGHPLSPGFEGWYAMAWAVLAFGLWWAARKDDLARTLFALGLCLWLFSQALAAWLQLDALTVLSGYFGLVTAIVGIYIAGAEAINHVHGHTVLPLGESDPDRSSARSG